MAERALLKRITVRPEVFGGKPIIRDMRLSGELILSLLAQEVKSEAILEDYPDLESDDRPRWEALCAYGRRFRGGYLAEPELVPRQDTAPRRRTSPRRPCCRADVR